MTKVRFAVLGGGPTGIGAALRLLERRHTDFLILDKEAAFGGLAGSETHKGWTWDYGCHVQHSHYDHFDEAMDLALGKDGWYEHERSSWIWIKNRFVPYPFQNNIHRLEAQDSLMCLEGMREAAERHNGITDPPAHFGAWILHTFGRGISRLFLDPYNTKIWATPLERMDWRWIGNRVSLPDLDRIQRNIESGRDDVGWGPNSTFQYPKEGGTGAIWRSLADRIPEANKRSGTRVIRVDLRGHALHLEDGGTIQYEHLVSAIPVDLLADFTGDESLIEAARGLERTRGHYIGLGLSGALPDVLKGKSWIYFPEPEFPFYRATMLSEYSPALVPDAGTCSSLLFEVAEPASSPRDPDRVEEAVIGAMLEVGWIPDRERILEIWHRCVEWSYPVPSLGRDEALSRLLPALEAFDVYSRGRFGAWKYEVANQDHTFMQGVEAVDRILGFVDEELGPEPTLHQPDLVNSGIFLKKKRV
jgi:protoporphyrinogen oxidase